MFPNVIRCGKYCVGLNCRLFKPLTCCEVCLQNCKKILLASSCLSVRKEELASHWMDFQEIWYLKVLEIIKEIKV